MDLCREKYLLSPYRVLDLADEKGLLCGRVFGDLGADVIKIEGVGGDPARSRGPFYGDIPHPEKSLFWFAYNLNKRGITLNIETTDGREILKRLVQSADFVIESFSPGYLEERGLDYSTLKTLNPGLILISISSFGQDGPYRDFKGSDLVCTAMGGELNLVGDPDRPPVRISYPQVAFHACVQGVVGGLVALWGRGKKGLGQHVDVSIQQCVTWTTIGVLTRWLLAGMNTNRAGGTQVGLTMGRGFRILWPCKDGFIAFRLMGGVFGIKSNRKLAEWMQEKGDLDPVMSYAQKEDFDPENLDRETVSRIEEVVSAFFRQYTKAELYDQAIQREMILYPVSTAKDIFEDRQLRARDFWREVLHPELGCSIVYPGTFIRAPGVPAQVKRRAPRIGEHNQEIYQGELGFSTRRILAYKQAGII